MASPAPGLTTRDYLSLIHRFWFFFRQQQQAEHCAASTFREMRYELAGKRDCEANVVMLKKGDCEHCGRFYRYSLWHSGFGDNSYAYCNLCGMLAIVSYSNPQVAAFPPTSDQYGEIDESWEPFLRPCACGGSFRKGASPRCPFCTLKLSAGHATDHIEEQARGAPRGWRWQNSWSGVYCMAIEDPKLPGTLMQVDDPVWMPEVVKPKRRWSVLFSFGR